MGGSRSQSVIGLRGVAGSALFTSGQIEVLKWIALVAMLVGHLNRYVLDLAHGWMFFFGRQAFPLFALALGAALMRRGGDGDSAERCAYALFPFAVAAQIGVLLVGGGPPNILFLYLAAAAWVACSYQHGALELFVVRGLALVVAFLAEFSLPGFFFCIALWRWIETRIHYQLALAGVLFMLVSWLEGSFAGLLAPGIAAAVWLWRIELPRVRRLFRWAYMGQFPALIVLRGLYG